ncbi:hypothetical protein PQQ75_01120 [Paraburkholderia aspalathi]|uniref:hypothetical protein n=1 Tax=Paraburkholderia aspalathi TaxID=1324617 RepID=UPI0038BB54F0
MMRFQALSALSHVHLCSFVNQCSVAHVRKRLMMCNRLCLLLNRTFSDDYFLAAPRKGKQSAYVQALLLRYSRTNTSESTYEQAFQYLDTVVDRQISKASGLLTFDSILLAVLYAQEALYSPHEWGRMLLTALLFFACLVLFDMLYPNWSSPKSFETAEEDFTGSFNICCSRTQHLFLSMLLSVVALVAMMGAEIWHALCK